MSSLQLLIDFHKDGQRLGPGGSGASRQALQLGKVPTDQPLRIADIGCGTGALSLQLAQETRAHITAVDFIPEFLETLRRRAKRQGVENRIQTLSASMDDLPFNSELFDVIWSEGAVYNMGFERGISYWRQFLKPGGKLVVSELSWLTPARPKEIQTYWEAEYPEVDTAPAKLTVLERNGYAPLGYFPLPESCWENYFAPMRGRFPGFLQEHDHSADALALVQAEQLEMDLYARFSSFFGYGVYIAQRFDSTNE